MTYQSERKQFLAPSPVPATAPWYDSLPPGRLGGKPLTAEKTSRWELDLDAALFAEDRAEILTRRQAGTRKPAPTPPRRVRLDKKTVRYVHQFAARGVRRSEIARLCHVSESCIDDVLSGRTWKNSTS